MEQDMTFIKERYDLCVERIKEIAKDYRLKEGNVKVILHRTRQKFKEFLEREGI